MYNKCNYYFYLDRTYLHCFLMANFILDFVQAYPFRKLFVLYIEIIQNKKIILTTKYVQTAHIL